MNIAYNVDCMEYMKDVPDKYFNLAVVDPPYGTGGGEHISYSDCEKHARVIRTGGTWAQKYTKK